MYSASRVIIRTIPYNNSAFTRIRLFLCILFSYFLSFQTVIIQMRVFLRVKTCSEFTVFCVKYVHWTHVQCVQSILEIYIVLSGKNSQIVIGPYILSVPFVQEMFTCSSSRKDLSFLLFQGKMIMQKQKASTSWR